MAKTAKKAKKDNKPKPVRTAGRKDKKAEPKEAAKEANGPIGGNVTDKVLHDGIKAIQGHRRDLKEAQKEVKKITAYIRNEYKSLKAKGVDTDAVAFGVAQFEKDDQGARFMAWYSQRIAKVMNLPIGSQLSLLDPDKGGVDAGGGSKDPKSEKSAKTDEAKVELSDEVGLVAKANAYEAGNKAGKEAKPRYVPAKWRAYESDWIRGYDDGQSDNAAKIKKPEEKDGGDGPSFGKS